MPRNIFPVNIFWYVKLTFHELVSFSASPGRLVSEAQKVKLDWSFRPAAACEPWPRVVRKYAALAIDPCLFLNCLTGSRDIDLILLREYLRAAQGAQTAQVSWLSRA